MAPTDFARLLSEYETHPAFSEGGVIAARLVKELLNRVADSLAEGDPDGVITDDQVLSVEAQRASWRQLAYTIISSDMARAAAERIPPDANPEIYGSGVAFELQLTAATVMAMPSQHGATIGEFHDGLRAIAESNLQEAVDRYGPYLDAGVPDDATGAAAPGGDEP